MGRFGKAFISLYTTIYEAFFLTPWDEVLFFPWLLLLLLLLLLLPLLLPFFFSANVKSTLEKLKDDDDDDVKLFALEALSSN